MLFKVGQRVSVLDEDISGTITTVKNENITIETDDGFEFDFRPTELVLDQGLNFSNKVSVEILKEKEQSKKQSTKKTKAKERYQPTMEVDLHIHQLTDKKGLSNHDMLTLQVDTARRRLDFAIKKRIQKVVFIHGVGEGVLRTELEYLFGRYNNVKYYDANYQRYGLGATEVYIYQNSNPNTKTQD